MGIPKHLRYQGDGIYTVLFSASEKYAGPSLQAIAELFSLLLRGKGKRNRLAVIQCLVLTSHLAVIEEQALQQTAPDARVFVTFSRNKADYYLYPWYGLRHFTYRNVLRVVDHAIDAGLVESTRGSRRFGVRSRFRPIGEFRRLLLRLETGSASMVRANTEPCHLVLKRDVAVDTRKRTRAVLVRFPETADTERMRANIDEINACNALHHFELHIARETLEKADLERQEATSTRCLQPPVPTAATSNMNPDALCGFVSSCLLFLPRRIDGAAVVVDLTGSLSLHRVFNEGRWDRGGRFYGSVVQSIPSARRRHVTIDGQPVAEPDFKGMHPTMCYHLLGLVPAIEDPYDASKTLRAWRDRSTLRSAMKFVAMACLNCTSRRSAVGAVIQAVARGEARWAAGGTSPHKDEIFLAEGFRPVDLVNAFEKMHPILLQAGYLYSGCGLRLQNLDSQIAERVMLRLVRLGKPVMSLHDGFLVKRSDSGLTCQVMVEEYQAQHELHGLAPRVTVKGSRDVTDVIDTGAAAEQIGECAPRATISLQMDAPRLPISPPATSTGSSLNSQENVCPRRAQDHPPWAVMAERIESSRIRPPSNRLRSARRRSVRSSCRVGATPRKKARSTTETLRASNLAPCWRQAHSSSTCLHGQSRSCSITTTRRSGKRLRCIRAKRP